MRCAPGGAGTARPDADTRVVRRNTNRPSPTHIQRKRSAWPKRTPRASRSAVVIGATSKWQSDGRNTHAGARQAVDDSSLPVGVRWGVGGAIAQKFAQEGMFRRADHAHRGQRRRPGGRDPRAGRRVHDRRAGPGLAGFHRRGIRHDPPRRRRSATCWSTTPATWKAATCRRTRSCWNTSRWRCSTPRSTSPAAGRSWWPRKCCRRCGRKGDGLVLFLQQLQFAARQEADDRDSRCTIRA